MKESDNYFERLRDKVAERITVQQQNVYPAVGVGGRPYGQVQWSPDEQRADWMGMPYGMREQVWGNITPEERKALQFAGKVFLDLSREALAKALKAGVLLEVHCEQDH